MDARLLNDVLARIEAPSWRIWQVAEPRPEAALSEPSRTAIRKLVLRVGGNRTERRRLAQALTNLAEAEQAIREHPALPKETWRLDRSDRRRLRAAIRAQRETTGRIGIRTWIAAAIGPGHAVVISVVWVIVGLVESLGVPVDNVGAYNDRVAAIPIEDRAWPVYEAEFKAIRLGSSEDEQVLIGTASSEEWGVEEISTLRVLIERNAERLDRIVEASHKPHSGGFLYESSYLVGNNWHTPTEPARRIPISFADNRYLSPARTGARLFGTRARLAAIDGDTEAFLSNLEAMKRLGRHAAETKSSLLSQLVSNSIEIITLDTALRSITTTDLQLTEAQLDRFEQLATSDTESHLRKVFDGERLQMRDGMTWLPYLRAPAGDKSSPGAIGIVDRILAIFGSATIAPKTNLRIALGSLDLAEEAALAKPWTVSPLFTTGYTPPAGIWGARNNLAGIMTSSFDNAVRAIWHIELQRERHRFIAQMHKLLAAGEGLPMTAEAFESASGLATPTDPYTGTPVRFHVIDGELLVYSVGADLDDDLGMYSVEAGNFDLVAPPNGDYLLWPPDRIVEAETVRPYQ
ncbi:MAG: hypothetical protein AAGB51_07595 [Planctomycetota bacterium]